MNQKLLKKFVVSEFDKMKNLIKIMKQFKKNKSAFGLGWVAKMIITILVASLFIALLMKMIGLF